MILTFKVKHGRDFSPELGKAKKIAEFVLCHKTRSSRDVTQFGLKSAIANQILRKYGNNKTIKKVNKIKLTVPSQSIKVNKEGRKIEIPCLKFSTPYEFRNDFVKINQIELDNEYAFVSVSIKSPSKMETEKWVGVDRNTTGHIAVVGNPENGKIWKFGKEALHIHKKYKSIRRALQKQGKYKLIKRIKNRESRIIRNINHKISKEIVAVAKQNNAGIKLEALEGIRQNRRHSRNFNYSLHSWSFYQLQIFIEYKADLSGIPLTYVKPENTSKECSRCQNIGIRDRKKFVCQNCGHVDHADANASFNIAMRPSIDSNVGQLNIDRDVFKGSIDTPRGATL
jgi:putative transposase